MHNHELHTNQKAIRFLSRFACIHAKKSPCVYLLRKDGGLLFSKQIFAQKREDLKRVTDLLHVVCFFKKR